MATLLALGERRHVFWEAVVASEPKLQNSPVSKCIEYYNASWSGWSQSASDQRNGTNEKRWKVVPPTTERRCISSIRWHTCPEIGTKMPSRWSPMNLSWHKEFTAACKQPLRTGQVLWSQVKQPKHTMKALHQISNVDWHLKNPKNQGH